VHVVVLVAWAELVLVAVPEQVVPDDQKLAAVVTVVPEVE
jgi:hypothetical protein